MCGAMNSVIASDSEGPDFDVPVNPDTPIIRDVSNLFMRNHKDRHAFGSQ